MSSLENRAYILKSSHFVGMESTRSPTETLGVTVGSTNSASTPWFQNEWIFPIEDTVHINTFNSMYFFILWNGALSSLSITSLLAVYLHFSSALLGWKLPVVLCCWQFGYSVAAVINLALINRNPGYPGPWTSISPSMSLLFLWQSSITEVTVDQDLLMSTSYVIPFLSKSSSIIDYFW